ncbi:LuxR C-terminal-related transcriptional regulator [Streptomyces sp. NPDC096339]|uniref:LuxR C-terminal-related transcriptional regulator n=1 Tax=Streptomyces sp. NPDC096339 TaxID=3366086 RepID=UPI003808E7A6
MTGEPLSSPRSDDFDDDCALAYQHAVARGRYTRQVVAEALGTDLAEAARIEDVLRSLSLLLPMPGEPGTFVPVSPDAAAADLVGPTETRIRELQQAVTDVRARMRALEPAYFESRRRRNQDEAFDIVSDIDVLQAMLDDWGARSRTEVLTAQPGGPRPISALDAVRPRTLARLARGVKVRHLYQHTVRSDLPTTAYVREVTARGAEVRTTDELIDRIVIYDREIVFLPEQDVDGREPGAVVVREPTLVAFLCKVYEHLWAGATSFSPGAEEPTAVTDDLKRSIIRLMAQGHKDEMVARRLGMSVRTCRRYISQIMEELESTSRFQAGVSVAASGMLDFADGMA